MLLVLTRGFHFNLFIIGVNCCNKFTHVIWFQNLTKLIHNSDKKKQQHNIFTRKLLEVWHFFLLFGKECSDFVLH